MWPLLPSQIPSPFNWSLFDPATLATGLLLVTILVLGGFVFLLARLTRGRREMWVVHCPPARARALVVIHRRADGKVGAVVNCSRWVLHRSEPCNHSCLPRAA